MLCGSYLSLSFFAKGVHAQGFHGLTSFKWGVMWCKTPSRTVPCLSPSVKPSQEIFVRLRRLKKFRNLINPGISVKSNSY